MPLSIQNPHSFSFIQTKVKRLLIILVKTAIGLDSGRKKHYTCKGNDRYPANTTDLLLHLSNINNYKQSSATSYLERSLQCYSVNRHKTSLFFTPLVLFAYLGFFLFSEVILDIECFANLFRSFSLDHICNSLACDIKQTFNV